MNDLEKAHGFSFQNKPALENTNICGCFHCLKIFHPDEIEEWMDDSPDTAVCPFCHMDSVIGENAGFPITEEFLKQMKNKWF